MGMILSVVSDHHRKGTPKKRVFKREAVHNTLRQLQEAAGDRTVLLFGDSNIEGYNEMRDCFDEYQGFNYGYSFIRASKDFIIVGNPGHLQEVSLGLHWQRVHAPMVVRIVGAPTELVSRAPEPPDFAVFARGGDSSDLAEARTVLQRRRIHRAEVDEGSEEQDRHVTCSSISSQGQ